MKELSILLVDDHQIIIDGIKALIDNQQGLKVIDESSNGK